MGTSEDLVPKGLPYGAREKTVAAMRSADVPVSSEGGGGSPPTAPATTPVAPAPTPPARPVDLESYDVFSGREPTVDFQRTPPRRVLYERVRQSPNQVMQSIFERMAGYKEG